MKTLTPDERRVISVAKVGSDHGTDFLIAIIERLTGEEIEPADTPPYREPSSRRTIYE